MKLNKQLFGWLGASALLLTTACTNEEFVEPQGTPNQDLTEVYGNGSKIITLSVGSEAAVATRTGEIPHISDGSNVNMLFFEVYDMGETETNVTDANVYVQKESRSVTSTSFPVSIKLAVDPAHKYKIALWAQHITTKNEEGSEPTIDTAPFSFEHLTSVTVDYSGADNNDEFRDAFCAAKSFSGDETNVSVVLHRPFAQLNVGTTGADYNNYMSGNIYPHKTIKYSKMVVKGVANQIDVANDKISIKKVNDSEDEISATFSYAALPAFYNMGNTLPSSGFNNAFTNEEFLRVKLNDPSITKIEWTTEDGETTTFDADENGFFKYATKYWTTKKKTSDVTVSSTGNKTIADETLLYLTETFRYLSMAYVLVPTPTEPEKGWDWTDKATGTKNSSYDTYNSSTLSSVEVYFGESKTDGFKYFTINNVPVHRNWRTNLIGGLYDPNDDSDNPDPEDPDDPTSVFSNTKIAVNLCPIYYGEFNGKYDPSEDKEDDQWDGIGAEYFPNEDGSLHDHFENKE